MELRRRTEAERGCFIVEGPLAIERLVASTYRPRCFLFTPKMAERLRGLAASSGAPVYVAEPEVLAATVGFDLHRGAVASAERPQPADPQVVAGASALLVVEGVNDHENLGALFRNAASFGVGGVLLDPTCADPLYRRCVRVSMGHVLRIPFAIADQWPLDVPHTVVALTPDGEVDIDDAGAASAPRAARRRRRAGAHRRGAGRRRRAGPHPDGRGRRLTERRHRRRRRAAPPPPALTHRLTDSASWGVARGARGW